MLTELARWVKGVAKLDAWVCRQNFLCYRRHRACRFSPSTSSGRAGRRQQAEHRGQRSDIGGQGKLISDLRLLTSVTDDLNDFNGLNV
jgi:hypothetical protein